MHNICTSIWILREFYEAWTGIDPSDKVDTMNTCHYIVFNYALILVSVLIIDLVILTSVLSSDGLCSAISVCNTFGPT